MFSLVEVCLAWRKCFKLSGSVLSLTEWCVQLDGGIFSLTEVCLA